MKKIYLSFIFCMLILLITGCGKYVDYCEDGYELTDGMCTTIKETKDAEYTYYCNNGDTLNDHMCEHNITTDTIEVEKCDNGYLLANGVCSTIISKNANASYSCSSGTLNGTKCVRKAADPSALVCSAKYCTIGTYDAATNKCKSVAPITGKVTYYDTVCGEYSCSRGVKEGNMCYVDYSSDANVSYSCESGYNLSGTKCNTTVTKSPNKVSECPTDYTLINNECIQKEYLDANKEYYCEDNYQLIDNKCIMYESIKPLRKKA